MSMDMRCVFPSLIRSRQDVFSKVRHSILGLNKIDAVSDELKFSNRGILDETSFGEIPHSYCPLIVPPNRRKIPYNIRKKDPLQEV